jgi:hypothetical protein
MLCQMGGKDYQAVRFPLPDEVPPKAKPKG